MDIGKLSTKITTPTVIQSLKWRAITVLPSEVGPPLSAHSWQPWWILCPFCLKIECNTHSFLDLSEFNFSNPLSSAFLFLLLLTARIPWSFLLCSTVAINFSRFLRGTLTDFDPSPRIFASLLNPLSVESTFKSMNFYLLAFRCSPASSSILNLQYLGYFQGWLNTSWLSI